MLLSVCINFFQWPLDVKLCLSSCHMWNCLNIFICSDVYHFLIICRYLSLKPVLFLTQSAILYWVIYERLSGSFLDTIKTCWLTSAVYDWEILDSPCPLCRALQPISQVLINICLEQTWLPERCLDAVSSTICEAVCKCVLDTSFSCHLSSYRQHRFDQEL